MSKGLTDDERRRLAEAIASLSAPRLIVEPGDPVQLERARNLICQHRYVFCHRPHLSRVQQVLRLAGQRQDYLAKVLRDYKRNARCTYDAAMANVLDETTDEQLVDLAYFLARLP